MNDHFTPFFAQIRSKLPLLSNVCMMESSMTLQAGLILS